MILFCSIFQCLKNSFQINFRNRKNIDVRLGFTMALITSNQNMKSRGGMGLGTDKIAIQSMINKIWDDFDVDNNGNLTKFEMKGFISKAF